MAAQAAPTIPPNDPISIGKQEQQVDDAQANGTDESGQPFELQSEAAAAATKMQEKYAEERDKRVRADGDGQYIDLALSEKFKHFRTDPWLNSRSDLDTLHDGQHVKFLVLGGGFGGLLMAIKLVKQGFPPDDIRIIETAGGFGGTWYWNRYPGLMCDVESYVYLPLLEDMGYMPKHKYSYGSEIRAYVNALATKYGLDDKAMFRTKIDSLTWNDESRDWTATMISERTTKPDTKITVRTQHAVLASGLLLYPKLPATPGIELFKGHSFHTSRWDYSFTGGSPTDTVLSKLQGKRVGIIGTGATAVQALPHLAKWAKVLVVFQRTPSSVDERGQKATDPAEWNASIAAQPGWHKQRQQNFNLHITNTLTPEEDNKVKDQWTKLQAYHALIGGPGIVGMEQVPSHVAKLHTLDFPRSERVRQRVDDIVLDQTTASKLRAYYPSWCKRPCFHDDYLQCFNQPNVTLVDTQGKGVDQITEKGIIHDGKEHELDLIIYSTGFRSPVIGSPAGKAHITVKGKGGLDFDEKYDSGEWSTLHGVCSNGFPNLWWAGMSQAGASANQSFVLDLLSDHVSYMIKGAEEVAQGKGMREDGKWCVEVTKEAEAAWAGEILMRVAGFSGLAGCTPSYLNGEGKMDSLPMEERMKGARMGIFGEGIVEYEKKLKEWKAAGGLAGLKVSV